MKCLIVETYFNVKKAQQEDQEKLRNEIIDQLRTSGIVIVDGRRCKVTPCEVDIVMLKPTETESSIEDAASSAMANASLFPLAPSDITKIETGLTVSHVLGCPTTD